MLDSGFLLKIVEPDAIDETVADLCQRAVENAPLTTRALKEAVRRNTYCNLPNIDDLIARVYGSQDFHLGVKLFLEKAKRAAGMAR